MGRYDAPRQLGFGICQSKSNLQPLSRGSGICRAEGDKSGDDGSGKSGTVSPEFKYNQMALRWEGQQVRIRPNRCRKHSSKEFHTDIRWSFRSFHYSYVITRWAGRDEIAALLTNS
jgi:hypothetical protein